MKQPNYPNSFSPGLLLPTCHLLRALLPIVILLASSLPGFTMEESVRQEIEDEATRERESEAAEDPLITRQTEKN